MQQVVIFEDGKGFRGQKAKLIKRGNKRVLIEFTYWDYEADKEVTHAEWFTLFTKFGGNKHNNKRKQANYCHQKTNMFYTDHCQTDEYKADVKEYFTPEYYSRLFGGDYV